MAQTSFGKHRLLSALSLSSILVACGGGGGSDGPALPVGPQPVDVEISGQALAGSALSGVVNVYRVTEDGERGEAYTDEVTTSENKDYSISFSGLEGDAVLVELTSDGSEVLCGLPVCERDGDGNAAVSYGESHRPTISLSGMVVIRQSPTPSSSSAITRAEGGGLKLTANLNAITKMAALLALQDVKSNDTNVLKDVVIASNAKVANRFGIGDLNLVDAPQVDLTNPTALGNANKNALENSLKISGLLGAAVTQGKGNAIDTALDGLSSDYLAQGLADREEVNSGAVTVEESLEEALLLIDKLSGAPAKDEVKTVLTTAEADAQTNGSTASTQGNVPANIGEQGLVATKAMVSQIRDLIAASDMFTPTTSQAAFRDEVEATELLLAADLDVTSAALEAAGTAIGNAIEAYENSSTPLTSYSENGITVAITTSGNTVSYSVDQDVVIETVTVAVTATAVDAGNMVENMTSTSNADGSTTETYTGSGDGEVALSGSAETDKVTMTLKSGSKLVAKFSYNDESTYKQTSDAGTTSETDEWSDRFTLDSASLVIDVAITEKAANPVAFTGSMNMSLTGLNSTTAGNYENSYGPTEPYSDSETYTETTSYNEFTASLSGELSAPSGSFTGSMSFTAGAYSVTCDVESSYGPRDFGFSTYEESETCVDTDTNSDFAEVSFSVILNLDVAGVSDDMRMAFSADRNGLEDGELELDFTYEDGRALTFDYNSRTANRTVNVTNHNGVVMRVIAQETVSGDIKSAGTKYAELDEDAGILTVTYTDGTFESFAL
ncbi:hypothetical protein HCU74_13420 [Spongiibacter sp. KMU-166]|uniref:Uncharacterized protein n=1 Tax=Spongiibacter thalassae TaxID=2721624 RepID=A0ABX1GGZ0_9GAMM|nr:hypothetical protein [Spongiibacter thalassae]NKI18411.1 hypothetical protein [Spongiibacter thalassae]